MCTQFSFKMKKNVRNAASGMGGLTGEKILNIVQGMVRYALGYFLMNYTSPPIIHCCYSNVKMKNGTEEK